MRQWERRLWEVVTEDRLQAFLRDLMAFAWPDKRVIRQLMR